MALEGIGKPFITICAFLGLLVVMTSSMSGVFVGGRDYDNAQSEAAHAAMSNVFSASDFQEYVALAPYTIDDSEFELGTYWNYYITPLFIRLVSTDAGQEVFEQEPDDIYVYGYYYEGGASNVHDPFNDPPINLTFVLYQPWGIWDVGIATVDTSSIISGYDPVKGYSSVDVLLKSGYVFIYQNDTGTSLEDSLSTHTAFTVSVAQTTLNASLASANVFGLVSNILSFSIPNVNPIVNMILAAVLIPTYLFMIFVIIRSLIPTLG